MKLFFMLLACAFALPSFTQNQLSGKIISKQTGEPVSANIYFPKLEKGTLADLDGNYTITHIPPGTFNVVYSALGYATHSIKISFGREEQKIQDIILEETAVEMEEVIISTPFHRLQSENVMRIDRISAEKMRKSGAATLAEGIRNIPGVDLISTGVGIGKPVIRGLSSNRVLTYAQGIRMENQQFGEEHGLGLNDAGIESVEVIKGPASLLYGSDALGGVLYFNPERFAAAEKTEADWNTSLFSNTVGYATTVGAKKSWNNFRVMARAALDAHSDYKTGDHYRVTNSRFSEKDFKTGFQYADKKWKSTFRYNYNQADLGIPEELEANSTAKKPLLPFQEVSNHILSWENKFFFGSSHLDATMGYLVNDRKEFEDDADNEALGMQLSTLSYDLKYHLPEKGKFQTIVGLQGLFQTNRNYGEEILIPDASTTDIGLLATTHYHLETIDFQAGVRFDNRKISTREMLLEDDEIIPALTHSYNSFTAALGAKKLLYENFALRLNLANGFRAPNLAELTSDGIHEGTYRYERGNSNLTNEKNIQADLSLEFRNSHFEVAVNTFYNAVRNYIYQAPTDVFIDNVRVYDYLQQHAVLYGGEIGFHLHPHPWDWLHWESNFEIVTGKSQDGNYLPLIPAPSFKNTIRIDKEKLPSFFVSLNHVFDQNRNSDFETRSGGYSLLDAGIENRFLWKKTQVSLGLSATNLTNKKYVAHLSRFKEEGFWNPGRSFVLRVGVRL